MQCTLEKRVERRGQDMNIPSARRERERDRGRRFWVERERDVKKRQRKGTREAEVGNSNRTREDTRESSF